MASFVRSITGAGLLAAAAIGGSAQGIDTVSGIVARRAGESTLPVGNAWVILHRVARDTAAAVDSVRSDPRGRFTFRRVLRGDSAVFFASTTYAGVAYFTVPFRGSDGAPAGDTLTVFDTTSIGPAVRTRGRHIVVSMLDPTGYRPVVEIFQIENTTGRTRVAGAHAPTWSTPIPVSAADVRVEPGDIAPDAVVVREGRVDVFAPLPPGLRQLALSYALSPSAFPATMILGDTTAVLEVLLEDPGASAEGAGLTAEAGVTLQGRPFLRFAARDVPGGSAFLVAAPAGNATGGRNLTVAVLVGLIGVALLLAVARAALGHAGLRARSPREARAQGAASRAHALARAIAKLDARFAKRAHVSEQERAAYRAERDALDKELSAVLAERDEQL